MLIPVWTLLGLVSAVSLPADTLECTALSTPLTSGHRLQFQVNDEAPGRLLAVAGDQYFERIAVNTWHPRPSPASSEPWTSLPASSALRLPTGQKMPVYTTDSWVSLGLTEAGILELNPQGESSGAPVGLPFVTPLAVATNPTDANESLIAGQPEGLFLCTALRCQRLQDGQFLAVAWFSDHTRFASDSEGGLWTYTPQGWTRRNLAEAPIVSFSGVPDGGHRYLLDATGSHWLSADHGRTWQPSPPPAGEYGPAGILAVRRNDGALEIRSQNGPPVEILGRGSLPQDTPLRWADANRLVAGLEKGILLIHVAEQQVRQLQYPGGEAQTLLDAGLHNEHLMVYTNATDPNCFRSVSVQPAAVVEVEQVADVGWSYISALLLCLGGLFWLVQRALPPRQRRD